MSRQSMMNASMLPWTGRVDYRPASVTEVDAGKASGARSQRSVDRAGKPRHQASRTGCCRLFLLWVLLSATAAVADDNPPAASRIRFADDSQQGQLQISIDGKEAIVYGYGEKVDLPHFYPVRAPSGQPLTVQQTDPYPHHRSVWFADTVQLEGQRSASFYNALYSRSNPQDVNSPYKDRIRHVSWAPVKTGPSQAELEFALRWEIDAGIPVLDEKRQMRVVALQGGEYFFELTFLLTASFGDTQFLSDRAHYAWPYIRMNPAYSVQQGGQMTNSEGGINQAQTDGQIATWVDYSHKMGGDGEGLALFSHPDNGHPHRWLTRDYGTFGPRRPDDKNGKKFTLKKGEQLKQRVGILVHRGDVAAGQVADRYQRFITGKL